MAVIDIQQVVAQPVAAVRDESVHSVLCKRAVKWLRAKGCKVVLTEFTCQGEIPDAIGWRGTFDESHLIECKTSRADFFADRRKSFRRYPEGGMGQFRYFMCPPGIIRAEDLPAKWGLLYAHQATVTIERGRDPARYELDHASDFRFVEYSIRAERAMLLSAINRLQLTHGREALHEQMHATYASKNPTGDA